MRYRKCVVLASLWLAGCAVGVNFTKPADDRLVVGTSKEADVLAELGKPNFKSAKVVNGESLPMDTYAYAVGGSADGVSPGVTPARSLAVVFKDGLLVERDYTSSFKSDATRYDVDKAKSIKPGMTAGEVKALLGNPSGEAMYPITSSPASRGMLYTFVESKGFKSQRNTLLVEVDHEDRVTNSDFTQVGQL